MDPLPPAEAGKYGNITPTSQELELLELINENRTALGAPPVKLNTSLIWVARAHSQDMIDYDFLSHSSSVEGQFNGASLSERVWDYTEYNPSAAIGEVIYIYGSGINVEGAMASWKNSPDHWNITKNPDYKEVGLGLLEGEWDGSPNAGVHTAVFGGSALSVDLTLQEADIQFIPDTPTEGENVAIWATVHNQGSTDAYPVNVQFYDGDPLSGGILIVEKNIQHLLIHGESADVSLIWDTTGSPGSHEIYVVLDQGDIISETNEGNNMASRTISVDPQNPPIHLSYGWNLVSFPYIVSDTSLDSVLGSINGQYNAVQAYNSWDTSDPWKHEHTGKPQTFNDLHDLDNKKGFYIHVTDASGADLIIPGDDPTSPQNVPLKEGWNLVSYPSTTSRSRDDGLNNLDFGSHVDSVQYLDSSTKAVRDLEVGEYMQPGVGYWIHTTSDCTWEVNN